MQKLRPGASCEVERLRRNWQVRLRRCPGCDGKEEWCSDRQANRSFHQMGNYITTSNPICFSAHLLCLHGCCREFSTCLKANPHVLWIPCNLYNPGRSFSILFPSPASSSSLFLFWSLYSVLRKSFRIKTKNKLPVSDATAPTTLSF